MEYNMWTGDLDDLFYEDEYEPSEPRYIFTKRDRELYNAVCASDLEAVRRAIAAGGNVNAVQEYDGCILQTAAHRADEAVIDLLLSRGAEDINTGVDSVCGSAVTAAARGNRVEILKKLLDSGIDPKATRPGRLGPPIIAAAEVGCASAVKVLLDYGVDPNEFSYSMYATPLQAAAKYGSVDTVRVLLQAGAKVNTQGGYHGDALQAAARYGFMQVVEMLLDAGADPTAQCGVDGSALKGAKQRGHVEVAKRLEVAIANYHKS
ncbi:ankyrin repeat-containing domain protein [Sphaerosporella brunnea]|uniref:Ankyrin repeat-containing domain protein n=1 Tax=Sphaerosporella brunnea TaxID=1250544 RepID=A0A5J5FA38_9PEZI|nr:ankyrin repeat-containing domain protein [Sphaerosporella brunnea]